MSEKKYFVKILNVEQVTYDVKRFTVEKPAGLLYVSGQATDISLSEDGQKQPFTFTSLPDDEHLEFTIKIYNARNGVTKQLGLLKKGDVIVIHEPFGAIYYKGKGVFIAGGAGVTPFISILRSLKKENLLSGNTLIFSNKTEKDIILKKEFDEMEGLKKIYVLTREKNSKFAQGRIDIGFLKQNISDLTQEFYVCGPGDMVLAIQIALGKLGVKPESVIIET